LRSYPAEDPGRWHRVKNTKRKEKKKAGTLAVGIWAAVGSSSNKEKKGKEYGAPGKGIGVSAIEGEQSKTQKNGDKRPTRLGYGRNSGGR